MSTIPANKKKSAAAPLPGAVTTTSTTPLKTTVSTALPTTTTTAPSAYPQMKGYASPTGYVSPAAYPYTYPGRPYNAKDGAAGMPYYPYGHSPMAPPYGTGMTAPMMAVGRATATTTKSGVKRERDDPAPPREPYYGAYGNLANPNMYARPMTSGVKVPRTGSSTTKSTVSSSMKAQASSSRGGTATANPRLPTALQSSPAAITVSKSSQNRTKTLRNGGGGAAPQAPQNSSAPLNSNVNEIFAPPEALPGTTFDFNGGWILDKVKSEPMDAYLQAMGLPEQAIQAARKAEEEFDTLNFMEYVNNKRIKIRKMSRMGDDTREYESDNEINEAFGRHGQKKVFATCRVNQVEIKTTMPDGKIVMDKRFYEGFDANVMAQHLTLITAKDQVLVKRWFSRTMMTPEEAKNPQK